MLPRRLLPVFGPNFGPSRAFASNPSSLMGGNSREALRKLILAEYELFKHRHPAYAPQQLNAHHIEYLSSLYKLKTSKRTKIDTSYQLRRETLAKFRNLEDFDGQQNLMLPFTGSEIEKLLRRQQTASINFLPNIIFDISFDKYMSSLECKNLAEQLIYIFYLNKFGIDPQPNNRNLNLFNLHVTNLSSSNSTRPFLDVLFYPQLRAYYPNVFLHDNSFEEVFQGRQLIYMSPHAEEVMTEYDDNALYIIGGIVDRREIVQLTPNKCQQLGIKSVKLPLDLIVRNQVQSLYDVYKFIHEFRYNSHKANTDIYSLVKKHIPGKRATVENIIS